MVSFVALCWATQGCGAAVQPLDPSIADERVSLPDGEQRRYGAGTAYQHYTRGEILVERGDLALAADQFRAALSADPNDSYLHVRLAFILIELGESQQALRLIKKVLKWQPSNEFAWLALAEYHWSRDELEKAEAAARRAMRVEPSQTEAAVWLAASLRERGDEVRAAEILRRVVEVDPQSTDARLELGRSHLARDEHGAALEHLAGFVELRPHRADVIELLGDAHLQAGEPKHAADLYSLATSKDSANDDLRLKLIHLLLDLELDARAARHLRSLRPPAPDDFEGGIARVCLLARTDQIYRARSLLVSRQGVIPVEPKARLVLAELEILLERVDSARLILEKSSESWPSAFDAHRKRLLVELSDRRKESAPCGFLER